MGMLRSRSGRVSLALSLLLGCAEAPAVDPVHKPAPGEPVKVVEEGKEVKGTPEPVARPVTASADAVARSPATPKPEEPAIDPRRLPAEDPPGTGFWLAAGRDGDLMLTELGSEFVVAGAGVMAHLDMDGSLAEMPAMHHGMLEPEYMGVEVLLSIGGRWPDPVWMTAQSEADRTTTAPFTYYRKGQRWQRKSTGVGPLDWYYQAFAPWTGEQTLALRLLTTDPGMDELYGGDLPPRIVKRMEAAIRTNPPRFDVLAAGAAPKPASMKIAAEGRPIDFATLPTGEVFVLLAFAGKPDDVVSGAQTFAVQRFAPGEDAGTVDRLPEHGGARPAMAQGKLVARAANEVYLAGAVEGDAGMTALITRFDGQTWKPIALPPGSEVVSLAFGADGVPWAVVRGPDDKGRGTNGLWKRASEGAWTEVTLPRVRTLALAEPRFVFGSDDDDDDWREVPGDPVRAAEPMDVEPGQVTVHDGEVWVVASVSAISQDDQARQVVLRSRPVKRALELTDSLSLAAEMAPGSFSTRVDPKTGCHTGFTWMVLATLAPGAGADAGAEIAAPFLAALPDDARPLLRSLREFRVRGRRVVAATAGFVDSEIQALLAATDRLRPGEEHPFECGNPRPVRSFYEHG